jgi:hypothetical protein
VNQKNEKDYNDMLKKWENAILEHEKNKNIFLPERDAFNEKSSKLKRITFQAL